MLHFPEPPRDQNEIAFVLPVKIIQEQLEEVLLEKNISGILFQLLLKHSEIFCENRPRINGDRIAGRKRIIFQELRHFRKIDGQPGMIPFALRISVMMGGSGRPDDQHVFSDVHFSIRRYNRRRIVKIDQQPRPGITGFFTMADHSPRHGLPIGKSPDQKIPARFRAPRRLIVVK
ncbi:hypothetical protein SDC9_149813 [bioreactor metagenome]|uniref:Uncharacterized protein n=1 Tax=bioreactor metagenome TaxID=1076179 RepID=A0A645ELE2_9ZZZZ